MDNNDVVKLYEKEIEIFLGTMGIFKGAKYVILIQIKTKPIENLLSRR